VEEALVKQLRFHEEAAAELDAAIGWYNARRDGLGLALHGDVQAALTASLQIRNADQSTVRRAIVFCPRSAFLTSSTGLSWMTQSGWRPSLMRAATLISGNTAIRTTDQPHAPDLRKSFRLDDDWHFRKIREESRWPLFSSE
jgi:hypothetical protein